MSLCAFSLGSPVEDARCCASFKLLPTGVFAIIDVEAKSTYIIVGEEETCIQEGINPRSKMLTLSIKTSNVRGDFLSRTAQFLVNGTFETHRGRVINILTYAALLDWNDFNTVTSTRILTFLAAVSTALTTLIVSKKWGVVSGAVFAYIIVEFANGHIGGVSSEMPGLIFGLLAFCFFLSVSQKWSGSIFLFGLLSLCFSLLTRVGAVFILPAIIIWAWHLLH